jgi:PAS domain S-box-containing protein
MDRAGEVLSNIDIGDLGRTMLDAADAAHIGVTVTLVTPPARNVFISEAAAQILGWSVQELLQGNPIGHIAPEDLPRMRERLERRARGERGQNTTEIAVMRKDGERFFIEMTASDVVIGGQPAVFAFIVDVSARKAAEQHRRQTEARFRELIESAPEPIGITRAGRFIYANLAYVATLGFPDAQTLYRAPLDSLLDPDEAAMRDKREGLILEQGASLPSQIYRTRRPDGSIVLLEVSSVYFEYEGKPSVLNMARDITARKRLEMQLLQADRLAALGTLAAGVAHEINNPLAYLMLNLEWIGRKLPDAIHEPANIGALVTMLDEARHGAQRVSAIVRELRSFSRADGETRGAVDLAAVARSAIKITGHEIRHRARVSTSFEAVRPVWANEARVEQVVINLLMNAAQAMPEKRAEDNEIVVVVRERADGRAVLEVTDNGEGIPPEVLQRIFDPFFTTKPVGLGTGLGLSICHGIVTSLGGEITAHSEPGKGTTLRVVLPTTEPRENQPPVAPAAPRFAGSRRGRILVIDDEPTIAHTIRDLLAVEHEVSLATGAREALALIGSGEEFDVIFCDLMMPGMSGVDFYAKLSEERTGLEHKIVFMTGGAFTARTAEFLASIDNRRLEKPFGLALLERIAREMTTGAGRPGHGETSR